MGEGSEHTFSQREHVHGVRSTKSMLSVLSHQESAHQSRTKHHFGDKELAPETREGSPVRDRPGKPGHQAEKVALMKMCTWHVGTRRCFPPRGSAGETAATHRSTPGGYYGAAGRPKREGAETGRSAHRWRGGEQSALGDSFGSSTMNRANWQAASSHTAGGRGLHPDAGQLRLETAQTLRNRGDRPCPPTPADRSATEGQSADGRASCGVRAANAGDAARVQSCSPAMAGRGSAGSVPRTARGRKSGSQREVGVAPRARRDW